MRLNQGLGQVDPMWLSRLSSVGGYRSFSFGICLSVLVSVDVVTFAGSLCDMENWKSCIEKADKIGEVVDLQGPCWLPNV